MNVDVNKWVMGALALIGVYLVATSPRVSEVVNSIATGASKVFKTLQARD